MGDLYDRAPDREVEGFLLRHRLCASAFDWDEQLSAFLEEMEWD